MILSDGFVNILIVVRVHNRGVKVYDWYWSNIRQIRPLGFFLNDREIFCLYIFLAACLIWLFALSSLLLNWLVLSGPTISLGLERPTLLNSIYSVDFISMSRHHLRRFDSLDIILTLSIKFPDDVGNRKFLLQQGLCFFDPFKFFTA